MHPFVKLLCHISGLWSAFSYRQYLLIPALLSNLQESDQASLITSPQVWMGEPTFRCHGNIRVYMRTHTEVGYDKVHLNALWEENKAIFYLYHLKFSIHSINQFQQWLLP